jgi:CubicO group peptidase (beta-lactamase class C family)
MPAYRRRGATALPGLCQIGLAALLAASPMLAAPRATEADQVDRYLGGQIDRLKIPGLAIAVVQGGRIVLLRSYGTASVEFQAPVTDTTVFAINSVTKAFTGVAAMRLVEQGRLDLSAPVGQYQAGLPEAWRKVTIRQLLSHMSGLPDLMRAPTVETDAPAAWAWLLTRPVLFQPGERFHYCQTNYTLIQRVLNQIEGRALDAPLAGEQIRLAGMDHTAYGDAYAVLANRAPTYRWSWNGPMIEGFRAASSPGSATLTATSERFLPFRRASSGLNATAQDLARWMLALQERRLLKEESLNLMWTPVAFKDGRRGQWGLGWEVLERGSHHAMGMTGGGRAACFLYPEDGVAVAILTNLTGAYPEDMIDKIASIYAPGLKLSGVPALRIALEERGYDQILPIAADLQRRDPAFAWRELELNDWGYRLLSTGRAPQALAVFKLTADRFPESANAHDSLAQAFRVCGDEASALVQYRRVLALDPGNAEALRHLKGIAHEALP